MKRLNVILMTVLGLVSATAFAATPFPPWLQTYINQPVNTNGRNAQRVLRAEYDTTVHGGSVGSHGLGVTLPAKSIITNVFYYPETVFVDAVSAGLSFFFCEDSRNLADYFDWTGLQQYEFKQGAATFGTPSGYVKSIANQCEVTAAVASGAYSAGKMVLFIEYVNQSN